MDKTRGIKDQVYWNDLDLNDHILLLRNDEMEERGRYENGLEIGMKSVAHSIDSVLLPP